jgi:hypothetical protein
LDTFIELKRKKLTFSKPIGKTKKGRPPVRLMDNVQQDLQTLGVRNWKEMTALTMPLHRIGSGGEA